MLATTQLSFKQEDNDVAKYIVQDLFFKEQGAKKKYETELNDARNDAERLSAEIRYERKLECLYTNANRSYKNRMHPNSIEGKPHASDGANDLGTSHDSSGTTIQHQLWRQQSPTDTRAPKSDSWSLKTRSSQSPSIAKSEDKAPAWVGRAIPQNRGTATQSIKSSASSSWSFFAPIPPRSAPDASAVLSQSLPSQSQYKSPSSPSSHQQDLPQRPLEPNRRAASSQGHHNVDRTGQSLSPADTYKLSVERPALSIIEESEYTSSDVDDNEPYTDDFSDHDSRSLYSKSSQLTIQIVRERDELREREEAFIAEREMMNARISELEKAARRRHQERKIENQRLKDEIRIKEEELTRGQDALRTAEAEVVKRQQEVSKLEEVVQRRMEEVVLREEALKWAERDNANGMQTAWFHEETLHRTLDEVNIADASLFASPSKRPTTVNTDIHTSSGTRWAGWLGDSDSVKQRERYDCMVALELQEWELLRAMDQCHVDIQRASPVSKSNEHTIHGAAGPSISTPISKIHGHPSTPRRHDALLVDSAVNDPQSLGLKKADDFVNAARWHLHCALLDKAEKLEDVSYSLSSKTQEIINEVAGLESQLAKKRSRMLALEKVMQAKTFKAPSGRPRARTLQQAIKT